MADSTEIDRLVVVYDGNFKSLEAKLDKALKGQEAAARKMKGTLDDVDQQWNRLFGKTDPAKALDKVFDSTRFRILDTGAAKVGLFGSALESLGPAGLVAAAGVGAVFLAFNGAREAARFADEIDDAATSAHVTSDALQELRFALRATGGDEKGADEALQAFNVTLGKAAANIPKALKPFKELFGNTFSAADVKALGGVDAAIEAITKKLIGLSDAQKDAILNQFGLSGLKQALEGGLEPLQRLREEAHRLGLVMDADLVKRGGALNDEFETTAKVIDVQLKSALIDLGPILLDLAKFAAGLAKDAANIADAFKSIDSKRTQSLKDLRADFEKQANGPLGAIYGGNARKKIGQIDAELAARAKRDGAPGAPPATKDLADTSKTPPGPRDDTEQRTEAANAALAGATRNLLQAQGRLTEDVEARAAIERDIAAQELAGAIARLEKQKADVDQDKGVTAATKKTLKAKLDEAEAAERSAAAAKVEAINRQAAFEIEDRQIEVYRQTVEAQIAGLEVEAQIAATAAERDAVEKRILDLRQQLERDLRGTQIDRSEKTGASTPAQAAAARAALASEQAAGVARFGAEHRNPFDDYLHSIQDLDTIIQNQAIGSFRSLSDSLGDSAAKALGLKGALGQFVSGLVSAMAQRSGGNLFAAVAAAIPAFAGGTSFAPGGMAWVGEKGPELVNLPRGSQVISNRDVRAMSNAQAGGGGGSGGQSVNLFDLRGAVMTDDLLAQMNQISARNAAFSVSAARVLTRTDLARSARRRI